MSSYMFIANVLLTQGGSDLVRRDDMGNYKNIIHVHRKPYGIILISLYLSVLNKMLPFISIGFKALEYARSILRPKVVPQAQQPKTREPERAQGALRGNTRLREGLDLSQLATVEALRKRHE